MASRDFPAMHDPLATAHRAAPPLDQAHGLRRMFAHARVCIVPVVSNPNVAFGGVMLERLCTAFGEFGRHVLVVDAGERAGAPSELALLELAEGVERLAPQVSYLAARGLAIRHVDACGSTAPFLDAVLAAAPECDVVLMHAGASELCRLFARSARGAVESAGAPPRPLLLADDRPASVTHAYAAMKLLSQRAGLVVHDLLLGAAPNSPRSERIAMQLATCADDFLGAVLRDWAQIDPASRATDAPEPALRRLVREQLRSALGDAALSQHDGLPPAQHAGAAVHVDEAMPAAFAAGARLRDAVPAAAARH
jgi:flagellar biosynthesis protein FlhG